MADLSHENPALSTAVAHCDPVLERVAQAEVRTDQGFRPPLVLPAAFVLLATVVFQFTRLDLFLAGLFYAPSQRTWPWIDCEPWNTLYLAGCYPPTILGIASLVPLIIGLRSVRWRPLVQPSLFLLLMLALGPGLMVNWVAKPLCGRPRPYQVTDFGGQAAFVPVASYAPHADCYSFPCGHASAGFYLMAPAFLLARRRRRWAIAWLTFGIAAGLLMGIARMVQGRHFASDVLWAGAFVYFSGLFLYYAMGLYKAPLPAPAGNAGVLHLAAAAASDVPCSTAAETAAKTTAETGVADGAPAATSLEIAIDICDRRAA